MPKQAAQSHLQTLSIVLTGLVCALLCGLSVSWYHARTDRWTPIVGPANETVVDIVALNRVLAPYVKTQLGALYFCNDSTWLDGCTQITAAELPINEVHPKWLTCPLPFPQTPAAPGTVVDAYEVGQCAEARTYAKVVLLDNGTLWQWRRSYSWVQSFTIATAAVAGLLLGLLIGAGAVDIWRYLRTPVPSTRI